MNCKNCGAAISDDVLECPYCDAVVKTRETAVDNPPVDQPALQQPDEFSIVKNNPLLGKKYSFISAIGTDFASRRRVTSNIEVAEDRIFIEIRPKRFQKAPAILFEDITGIDIATRINLYCWIYIILCVIGSCAGQFYLLLLALFLIYIGRQSKITISQRNGVNVVVYSKDRTLAKQFKEEMKQIARIQ